MERLFDAVPTTVEHEADLRAREEDPTPRGVTRAVLAAMALPPKREIWWSKWRPWVAAQLQILAPESRPQRRTSVDRLPELPDRSQPVDDATIAELERSLGLPTLRVVGEGQA